jgi:hypothetical protein
MLPHADVPGLDVENFDGFFIYFQTAPVFVPPPLA